MIKIGKHNTYSMCAECGTLYYSDIEADLDITQHSIKMQHAQSIVKIDEKIAHTVSILNLKGYKTASSCQGGEPDFFEYVNHAFVDSSYHVDNGIYIPNKRCYILFNMLPITLKIKYKWDDDTMRHYKELYHRILFYMISTLPNAFIPSFEYSSNSKQYENLFKEKPLPRNLYISWYPVINKEDCGDLYNKIIYASYNDLHAWASNLPNIKLY